MAPGEDGLAALCLVGFELGVVVVPDGGVLGLGVVVVVVVPDGGDELELGVVVVPDDGDELLGLLPAGLLVVVVSAGGVVVVVVGCGCCA